MTAVNATSAGQRNNDSTDAELASKTTTVVDVELRDEYKSVDNPKSEKTPPSMHPYFAPVPLYTEMNHLLAEALPENGLVQGGFYDNEIGRELSKTIFDASLLTELTPIEVEDESGPFSATVEERYSESETDSQTRVKIDPLGFASVQSVDNVPTFYTSKIAETNKLYSNSFLQITKALESNDIREVIGGVYLLADNIAEKDSTEFEAAYLIVKSNADELYKKYHEVSDIPICEYAVLFEPLSKLVIDGESFFVAVAKGYEVIKTQIMTQWNDVLYESGLSSWYENECLSRGILPSDLVYTAGGDFATAEQNEFYTLLVGSSTPMLMTSSAVTLDSMTQGQTRTPFGAVENPYLQFIDISLGVAQNSTGTTAPENAEQVIEAYQKVLSDEVKPKSLAMAMMMGGDLQTLTAGDVLFTGQAVQSGATTEDNGNIFLNTDLATLWQRYEFHKTQIENKKAGTFLDMLGLMCNDGVSGLYDSLTDGLVTENLLEDNEYLTEKQITALALSCSQITDRIHKYLAGVIDLRFLYGSLSFIYNKLDHSLKFSDGDKNLVSAKSFFVTLGDWLCGKLLVQRKNIETSLADFPQANDFMQRYGKLFSLTVGFMSENTEPTENIFSENVSQTVTAMDEVLAKAQDTLSLPTDYIDSLRVWNDYPHFLVESQTKEQIFNERTAPLSHLVSDLLELRISPQMFYRQIKIELTNVEDVQALNLWVSDLAKRADELEATVLNYLRPSSAETFVNRLRYAIVALKNESEAMNQMKQRTQLPIDELISQDVASWSRQLGSGWPTISGQSSVFEDSDTTITPDDKNFLDIETFESLLTGNSGLSAFDATRKLIDFIANPVDGYFYNFCLVGVQRDEEGHVVDAFRDYQSLNELRLVLADIKRVATKRLDCCPAGDKTHLEDILYITSQLDYALGEITAITPPNTLWTQIQGGELVGMPYMNYYSTPPQDIAGSESDRVMTEARGVLQSAARNPDPLRTELVNSYAVISWVDTGGMAATSAMNLAELSLIEELAKSLPASQKDDFFTPLLNNLGHFDTLYYVGRIYERLSSEPTQEQIERRKIIKRVLVQEAHLTLSELEEIISNWTTANEQPWPLDIDSTKRAILSALQITPLEMIWLTGFIGNTINTNKLVRSDDRFSDAIYQQELNLTEIDRHVDTMSRAEAADMLKKIAAHFAIPALLSQFPEGRNGATAVIVLVDDSWMNQAESRQISQDNLKVSASHTNVANLKRDEYIYAVLLISSEINGMPSQEELVRYQTYISSRGSINIKKVVAVVNRLSPYEKELFYDAHRDLVDGYYAELASLAIDYVAGDAAVIALPLVKFFDGIFVASDVNDEKLIDDLDVALAAAYPDRATIDGYLAESILHLIDSIIERLQKSTEAAVIKIKALFQTMRRALTTSFNKDNRSEVATVSTFNPNGYTLSKFATPKIGIESVFSLANLSSLIKQRGESIPTDPELEYNIKNIFDGIFDYFRTPPSLYLYETTSGLLCLDEGNLYVIIDDEKIELTFDSWLVFGDGKTSRLSENPLAQKIFIEAYEKIQGTPFAGSRPSAMDLQCMYVAVQSELSKKSRDDYVAEKTEALHIAFGDYQAASVVDKYFSELMCQALELKKRNAKIAATYSEVAFFDAMIEISNELILTTIDLSAPPPAEGDENYGTR